MSMIQEYHPTPASRFRTVLGMGCLFSLMGCALGLESNAGLECVEMTGCPENSLCFIGSCVTRSEGTVPYALDIVPPTDTAWLRQADRVLPRQINLSQLNTITLRDSVRFCGQIGAADGQTPRAAGELLALPTTDKTALVLPSQRSSRRSNVTNGGFTLNLLAGEYVFEFRPLAVEAAPPASWKVSVTENNCQAGAALNLDYTDMSKLVSVRGQVLQTPGGPGSSATATVQLLSATGYQSTLATTDAQGRFVVRIDPIALDGVDPDFLATIRPVDDALVPSFERLLGLQSDDPRENILEDVSLDLAGGAAGLTIKLKISDTGGKFLAGTTVLFVGDYVGAGTFRHSSETGDGKDGSERGLVTARLLPGRYNIHILPPTTGGQSATILRRCVLASQTASLTATCGEESDEPLVGDSTDLLEVLLTSKTIARLPLFDADGNRLRNAQVDMTRILGGQARHFSATTDVFGIAEVPVDAAQSGETIVYKIVVTPQQNGINPLPLYRDTVELEGPSLLWSLPLRILAPASLVYGKILGPYGDDIPAAQVAIYSASAGGDDLPILLGIAQTDNFGEFLLPVPMDDL